jgi:hypothetical protein
MKEGLDLALRVDIRDAILKLKDVEDKFKELQLADIEIDADTSGIINSIKKASKYAKNKADAIKSYFFEIGFAIRGAKEVFQLFSSVAGQLTEPASQVEQLKLRLSNLYGSADKAAKVYSRFVEVAKTTPYALSGVGEAGAQLKAFGVNAEENIKVIADLAAFMGVQVPEAASAMGRAFAGGAGAADVLRERGILALIKEVKGLDDLSQLTLPEFRKALLETLRDPSVGIAGATTKMANSYAGAISNMKDSWELFRAELGQKLTPVLANVARGFSSVVDSWSQTNFEKATEEASNQRAEFESLVSTYRTLRFEQGEGVETNSSLKETISKLRNKFGDYMEGVDLATISQKEFNQSVSRTSEELLKQAANKAVVAKKQDLLDAIGDARVAWITNIQKEQDDLQVWRDNLTAALDERKTALKEYDDDMATMGAANPNTQASLDLAEEHIKTARANLKREEAKTEANIKKINNDAKNKIAGLKLEIKGFSEAYAKVLDGDVDVSDSTNYLEQFNKKKLKIDEEYSRNKRQQLMHQLSLERESFEKLADSEVSLKEAKYKKIKELEKEIADIDADVAEKKQRELERKAKQEEASEEQKERKLKQIRAKYSAEAIADKKARIIKEIEIQREAALAEAREVKASKEDIKNINDAYDRKELEAINNHNLEVARKARQKYSKLRQQEQDWFDFQQLQTAQEDPLQAQLNAQLRALDRFFEKKQASLIANGMTEEEIERSKAKAKADINKQYEEMENQRSLGRTSSFFGNMATITEAFGKKGFKMWRSMAIAKAMVDTYASATAAFNSLAGIPIVGPALAAAAAGAAIASGIANVKQIKNTKPPKAEAGGLTGLLTGPSHANGGVLIEAEGEEYITRKQRVRELGVPFFDFINNAPLSAIKERFQSFSMPNIPMPSVPAVPQYAYASGGMVSGGSGLMETLIQEVRNLTQKLEDKEMVVNNNLSINADEVIDKASIIKVNDASEAGSKEKARW